MVRPKPILLVAFGFSLALGAGTVTIPLVALASGYDAASVGFLVAAAAAIQFGTRLILPPLLGRFPDRRLIGVAAMLMAAAFGLLVASTALPAFLLAQACQGAARATFWTSCQAHVVHGAKGPVRALIDLTLAGNAGTLAGPVLGGWLATIAFPVALGAMAVTAALAAAGAAVLPTHAPLVRRTGSGRRALLRREGQAVAAWGSVVTGAWWSMVGSYVPVLLVGAGLGPGAIGTSVTLSEAAGALVLAAARRIPPPRIRGLVILDAVVMASVLVAMAVVPPVVPAYLVLLLLGGAASGSVTALAPALASATARPEEQGDVMAMNGAFRAAALLVAPASVGLLLGVVPLSGGLGILGVALLASGLGAARPRRLLRPATMDA